MDLNITSDFPVVFFRAVRLHGGFDIVSGARQRRTGGSHLHLGHPFCGQEFQ